VSTEPDKQPDKIKCPKCGHEIQQDAGWLKVSSKVTCPACMAMLSVSAAKQQSRDQNTDRN